jgi:hypothetical protein
MAGNVRCDWCNNYGASTWTMTIGKKKSTSVQKFCSLKCKTQFEDRRSIDWVQEKEKKGGLILFIIIIFLLYVISQG